MRFLLDEMLSPAIASQLRRRGVDALAVVDASDLVGAPDAEVLAVAAAGGRVVVTENIGDFVRLHRDWLAQERTHAGILLVSTGRFPYGAARIGAITAALAKRARGDDALALDFL